MAPELVIVIALLVAPLGMAPVSKPPPSWVAVWVTLSVFLQATVCPTCTATLFGLKDMPAIVTVTSAVVLVPLVVPPVGIDMLVPLLPPQLAASSPAANNTLIPVSPLV